MQVTVCTEEARKGFYPTPPELADELIAGIDWWKVKTVLEPSVGSGNLVKAIGKGLIHQNSRFMGSTPTCRIDMVEIDPALRGICTNTFSPGYKQTYWEEYQKQEEETLRRQDAGESEERIQESQNMEDYFFAMDHLVRDCTVRFVHEDFLQYNTMEHYDLIVMNPPFVDGETHLHHAISMQEKYGGKIRCILNAETLRNPCTNRRKALIKKLSELNADISYRECAFSDAERKTDVTVAIIKLDIPQPYHESEFFDRFRKAETMKQPETKDPTELTVMDQVEAVVSQYRVEVQAGISLIQEYIAMQPYILEEIGKKDYNKPIIGLSIASDSADRSGAPDINKYVRAVRLKYWKGLFMNKAIFSQFTNNLKREMLSNVNKMVDVEFDVYNIRLLIAEMSAKMQEGVKETILDLFQEMTYKHSYHKDVNNDNVHFFNGWKTNQVHCVNPKKVILPCYGVFSDYRWSRDTFKVYSAMANLEDIEKALNYLDGNMTAEVGLYGVLERANQHGQTRKIPCKFFNVTFFKKGTMHLEWTNRELIDRFNIYCCKEKGWLPPSYGTKKYKDMDAEEKAVIDSFHGDNTPGSGEAEYGKILARAGYYLAPASQQQLALPNMSA